MPGLSGWVQWAACRHCLPVDSANQEPREFGAQKNGTIEMQNGTHKYLTACVLSVRVANGAWTNWTPEKETEFLQAVIDNGGNVTAAAQFVNVSHSNVYHRKKLDPEFAAALEEAIQTGADVLENECRRRALCGVDEPVFYQGNQCVDANGNPIFVKKYSDTLAIFLLKGAKPNKYRERVSSEVSGPDGKPIQVDSKVRVFSVPDNGSKPKSVGNADAD